MAKWHRLRLPEDTPALLVQYSSTHQGYELYMTDFISVWSERLSRKDILQRAEQDATTIDPSEDTEQFSVLLGKIGEALRGTGGTTTLSRGPGDTLELITITELPAPLKPLKWSFYVSRDHPKASTQHLLLPLLKDEADWESRQRSLLDQLKQKDWVLGKLFDKIESLGVDLGTVFPSAAGLHTALKGDARSATAKAIKGVAPFDEQAWLAESHGTGLAANFVQEISTSEKAGILDKLKLPQDKWWEKLPPRPRTSDSAGPTEMEIDHDKQSKLQFAESEDVETDAGSEDDEFQIQRQETPPQLRSQENKPKIKKAVQSPRASTAEADEATATESEPEAEPTTRRRRTSIISPPKPEATPTQPRETQKRPRGGLGVIGGKKKKEAPAPAPAEPKPAETEARDATPPSTHTKPAKQPRKLGMIGGKAKVHAPSKTESTPEHGAVPSPPKKAAKQESPSPQKAALPKHKEEPPSSPPPHSAPPAPEPETEEEKANRKREELKRQLQAKSQAPAKKKRRF
ncbi:XLF/Cernunnos protein [Penicillium riverlandense]|uniref:XLF/Cernunnos protein n=1 Tax=Penicillium riverlandense TaxID=1903569 RepID=UPI002548E606|nr:XLF/Cernunnos protein [Penicillium riverlandense]KAJ5808674.1 XLF/Cernunnos protein [Penicillium riverlandense]